MVHSHMPVNHLLKQIENFQPSRGSRDIRPDWLSELIDRFADLFEPAADVGRVGFECRLDEDCWVVGLYLGSTEMIGGPEDGESRRSDFRFDLAALTAHFEEVSQFHFFSLPEDDLGHTEGPGSLILIEGRVDENAVRLQIHAHPPVEAGPAFRQYPDGHCEPVWKRHSNAVRSGRLLGP